MSEENRGLMELMVKEISKAVERSPLVRIGKSTQRPAVPQKSLTSLILSTRGLIFHTLSFNSP